jgi:hypothetical protein
MPEEQQDVVAESSPAPVESSNEVQETAQPETEQTETPVAEETVPVPEVRQPQAETVDEMGVPYKNRYMETQRKLQKLEETVTQLQQAKQQPETPKYTVEQLRAFAATTDDTNSRIWALNELDKVSKEELRSIVRNETQSLQKQQQETNIRQQTFNTVISRNPDLAVKDTNGNFLGFNEKSPLYNRMNFYMSNPEIAARPEALEIAEAFAVRDLTYAQKPVINKTIEKQANQIKSLQKKTMVEGAGKNSNITVSSRQAAIDRVKQTGTVKDAAVAMGAVLKDAGLMSE